MLIESPGSATRRITLANYFAVFAGSTSPYLQYDNGCYERLWNDTGILLKYYSPAHTDSDLPVNFTDADIVHVADTWWNGVYPFIDYSSGGSIDGQIRAG